tara:strand:- start:4339 stop:4605 length:267 start_codon:yes stop_codon:yes gene_type:complete
MKKLFMFILLAMLSVGAFATVNVEPTSEEIAESEYFGSCRHETKWTSTGFYWTEGADTATAMMTDKSTGSTSIYTVSMSSVICDEPQQ